MTKYDIDQSHCRTNDAIWNKCITPTDA